MNKQSIVCTLVQAAKLRELGIYQQSFFYHFPNPNLDDVKKKYALPDYNVVDGDTFRTTVKKSIMHCNALLRKA